MVKLMKYDEIKKRVTDIVFQPYFKDVDSTDKKIGDIISITPVDTHIITKNLQQSFGLAPSFDISNVSVDDISKFIYTNQISHKWNRRGIFSYILACFRNALGRRVSPDEQICKLKETKDSERAMLIDKTLTNIWKTFGIVIDLDAHPEWRIYNLVNRLSEELVKQGRAIDPREECANMDSFWVPIWTCLSFSCLAAILKQNFDVWSPAGRVTKKLENKLQSIKSYEELEDFVLMERIKAKIDKIVVKHVHIAGDFENRPNMSDLIIGAQKANCIQSDVQKDFQIKIDYDISGTRLSKLYGYVYDIVGKSAEYRKELFNQIKIAPVPNDSKKTVSQDTVDNKQKLPNRDTVFANVISILSTAVNRSTSIQTTEKLCDLFTDAKNPRILKQKIAQLEKQFFIKIPIEHTNANVYNICSNAYKSLVNKGLAEDLRITLDDMHPVWAAINKAIPYFVQLRSVLENELGTRISVYNLSNCRTYSEYKQMVIKFQILNKIRHVIAEHTKTIPQKITLSAPLIHDSVANTDDITKLYNECEHIFNIHIPSRDRKTDKIEDLVIAIIKNGENNAYIRKILNGQFEKTSISRNMIQNTTTRMNQGR